MTAEAIRKPITNFGKRRQISTALGFDSIPVRSQRVVAIMASTNAHTPIQTSRPITFIKVKALTAASAVPAIPGTCPA